ncbi:MAG: conjugal transfer protein TraN [Rubrivivax sp.]|nr:conjugal transfer protein TraN [Rubrivivax sp.]
MKGSAAAPRSAVPRCRRGQRILGLAVVIALVTVVAGPVRAQQQAQQATQQQQQRAFDSARAIGRTQAHQGDAAVRDGSSEEVVRRNVPGYNASPPATQVYSTQDTSAAAAQQRAHCAANPRDAECSAQAVGSTRRDAGAAAPSQQALASRAAVRDPSAVLGDVASTYNACSVGGRMISPEIWQEGLYGVATGPWQESACTKTLTVNPTERRTCQDGAVIASASAAGLGGPIQASAYCNTLMGPRVRVQVHAFGSRGSCSGPLDAVLDLSRPPAPGAKPLPIGQIAPHWGGGCYPVALAWDGPGCVDGQCSVTVHFTDVPGPADVLTCPAGQVPGGQIPFEPGYVPESGMCYAEFADVESSGGRSGGWESRAIGSGDNQVTLRVYWAVMDPGVTNGWQWPALHYALPLSFPQPRITAPAGESWANECAALEALAPPLPAGTAATGPVMPALTDAGTRQCTRTASLCTEGPSTRTIDGVSVSRACWSYTDTYACTETVAPPGSWPSGPSAGAAIVPLTADVARGCEPTGSPTCQAWDGVQRCTLAAFNYRCREAAARFEPALNCGNSSFCAGGSCWDSSYQGNQNFAAAYSQYQAHVEAAKDIDEVTLTIFKGRDSRCHRDNFGVDNCCDDSAYLQQCAEAEQTTVRDRDAGKCHQVGEYCSARSLGVCRDRTRTYCCFSSLLGRLVQEQGRVQIARDWGTPETPNCAGFTPDELARLDWSQFDLSEFYAHIRVDNPPSQAGATGGAAGKQPQCYYGNGQCGGGS